MNGPIPEVALPLLVEPHDPAWWRAPAFDDLLDLVTRTPHLTLLADSAQLSAASCTHAMLTDVLDHSRVVHFCDNGSGVAAAGHRLVAEHTARRIMTGQHLEVGLEWTGADRTPAGFLARYRAVGDWWARRWDEVG